MKEIIDDKTKEAVKEIENKMIEIRSNRSRNHQWSLSDFEVGTPLSRGKFGRVYLAREKNTKYMVALKMMFKSELVKDHMEHQVRREIEIQTHLNHPNILKMLTYFWDQKKIYLILEFAQEGELFKVLNAQPHKRFTEPTAAYYLRQVADALKYCHMQSVIHRDIKPENLLLFSHHVVKLADFGWSVHAPSKCRSTMCGTIDYLPPEMVDSQTYNEYVDNWCLGVLCYEFLCGSPPFESSEQAETFRKIRAVTYGFKPHMSESSRSLIQKLLVKIPKNRLPLDEVMQHPWTVKNCEIFTTINNLPMK
ncbi:aurora kinase C [Daktulosphaira vitifoliae]|uniref:aurora kinase C n=1 Tax=Daktulosphaira vitifoliae TaxID=58002 RepID=UPI0021A9EB4F|nr:aurora kinase C [Daktulosphaira vitifoliae]XP_050545301.1 aurora kinase C [Daktulosphaira vitifoliae]XP_050545302.1 aurora kinase C [Daktulosphaira vitifoliae]